MNTMTRIHIFDVEHGECNAIETPSGDLILIGVGHNSTTNWRPSNWLQQRKEIPHCIVLSNFDEDHLSDLPNFGLLLRPKSIKYNNFINLNWLERKKIEESGMVPNGLKVALFWIRNVFTGGSLYYNYGLEITYFYHSPTKFQDTNNLSVVTFIAYNSVGVMFPSDIEAEGWREFLRDPNFVKCLQRTNILIASHHGRESGYCREVFNYCRPHVVIISDKPMMHETQNHNLYAQHCRGLNFGGNLRKVLTTRNDGKITIDIPITGKYTVYINQSY